MRTPHTVPPFAEDSMEALCRAETEISERGCDLKIVQAKEGQRPFEARGMMRSGAHGGCVLSASLGSWSFVLKAGVAGGFPLDKLICI